MNQEKAKLMQEALKSAPIGILLLDENNQIQWHNETLEKILGITPEQLAIQSTDELSDELRDDELLDVSQRDLLSAGYLAQGDRLAVLQVIREVEHDADRVAGAGGYLGQS